MQEENRYTTTAIVFHWLLALLIIGSFGVGLYMVDLPLSPQRLKLYNWHKWAGVTILTLSVFRLLWRLTHPPPALPSTMPLWQIRASHLAHLSLYVLFFAVPLIGWAYSSAAGFPIVWFGVLPLPDWVPKDRELAEAIKPFHEISAWLLAVVVLIHIAAALKHHFINHDGVLTRMLPLFSKKKTTP
ncbi:MAG: cytochrome b [Burkholderiaceae bacterium]|nr:cytochrome b [Burkholderiaceae bacterium]